jgi:4-amino-4-deoxy-L-arabinose transferase-like glycosyltransferase
LESKFIRILGLISLGAGIFLVLSCFSSTGILPDRLVEATRLFKVFVFCVGILAAVSGTLSLIYPSGINRLFDFLSSLDGKLQSKYFYLTFCFACFIVALVLGLLMTQAGPGISPDSAYYIRTGESIFHGQGFYQIEGEPYTQWPPLYPLSIAAFMHLGFDAEQAARLIPILCFALFMFPVFFLGKVLCSVVAGYAACLILLVFTPLLFITSYAWTEMPYIFFSLMAILFLVKFGENDRAGTTMLCFAGLFTALAILSRYIGVVLLPVGLVAIILKNKSRLKNMVYQLSLFGLISVLPIVFWLYRNFTLTGNLVGYSGSSTIGLFADINSILVTIFKDFLFSLLPQQLNPGFTYLALAIIAAGFILLVVLTRTYSTGRKVEIKYPGKNYIVILYIAVYLVTLVIIRQIWQHDTMGTRQTGPVYPFLILAAISFIFYAYRKIEKPTIKPLLFRVITILCFLFFMLQASGSLSFYQSAKLGQGYNSPSWRNEQGINWIINNAPGNSVIYSDVAEGVGFLIKKPVRFLPQSGSEKTVDEFVDKLRNDEQSFIICFKEVYHRPYLLSNSELTETNQKYGVPVIIADFPNSTIWRVHR